MACWHDRSYLGDVQLQRNEESFKSWMFRHAPKGSIVLPLYLYEHSGMTMRTTPFHDPWDSGQVGVIVATPDAIRGGYKVKRITKPLRKAAEAALRKEVEIYDQFLRGQCWGYVFTDDDVTIDSCSGFFGSTLEETGLADAIPAAAKPLLEEAWDARQ